MKIWTYIHVHVHVVVYTYVYVYTVYMYVYMYIRTFKDMQAAQFPGELRAGGVDETDVTV